ncbi:Hpt domain-containing protein [Tundrisphaera lichenicola]|uniref:Hpt domain-containing protein n=1 Tax=Tundrisphaera lichenicola TaxID=2029860 RepID=UPI003EBB1510
MHREEIADVRLSLNRKNVSAFLSILLISIGVGVVTFRDVRASVREVDRVDHFRIGLSGTERSNFLLKDFECVAQCYGLTLDPQYPDSDPQAKPRLEETLDRLDSEITDDRSHSRRLSVLLSLVPPILIMLTSGNDSGDAARAKEPGIAAYLTKPIRAAETDASVNRLILAPACLELSVLEQTSLTRKFDRYKSMAALAGEAELLGAVVSLFLVDCPRLLRAIEVASHQSDAPALRRLAHTIRGVSGNFAIPKVVEAAGSLEAMGKSEDWPEVRPAYMILCQAIDSVRPALDDLCVGSR